MAKRGGGSSSSGGDSNTGLIVTLVFFVLMSITLGALLYFAYESQTKALADAKSARGEASRAKQDMDRERLEKLILRVATGNESQGDQQTLAGLKNTYADVFSRATGSLKELPKWNPATDRPEKTYQDLISDLRGATRNAEGAKKQAETNLQEQQKAWETEKAELQAKLTKAATDLKAANDATVAAKAERSKAFNDAEEKINEISRQLAKLNQDKQDNETDADRKLRSRDSRIDSLTKQLDEVRSKLPQNDALGFDLPKGKILRVDRTTGLAYINLGSADYLRPLLTFSVLTPDPSGRTTATKEPKAAIEVVSILEPHLATARIVSQADPLRNSILPGDLIFNPTWSPAQREHVALTGVIDLDNDGQDDSAEVARNLEKLGVVVDAYLDLRGREIKGPGMTERTSYLLVGDRPQLSAGIAADPSNPLAEAFTRINEKISEMETKAKDLGVQKVPVRRFLSYTGYPLPKPLAPPDLAATSYLRGSSAAIVGEKDQKDN